MTKKQIVRDIRNYRSIVLTLQEAFQGFWPNDNPYIIEVNLPVNMGIKRLTNFLQPVKGIEIEKLGRNRLYINIDEFDAEVVPHTTKTGTYFNAQPFNARSCIKVQSLPGELADVEVHEVQNVMASKFKVGDKVRVRCIYSNGTDYGRREIIARY